jgi:hypothetical protein
MNPHAISFFINIFLKLTALLFLVELGKHHRSFSGKTIDTELHCIYGIL